MNLNINIFLNAIIISFDLIFCLKYPDHNHGKLSECYQCKILTNSFNYWLDKTSRGKYEGGDAAWEESKLKSYAHSEIRFVEIQEGLCSELKKHQDNCYAVAEEAEHVLESWWFSEDPASKDLYTWLCIETLKDCCPQNRYGPACLPCLTDKKNDVCSGHGRCDGDGTRTGNGTCLCKKGFTGEICSECATNYFLTISGNCDPCHKSCDGCIGEEITACKSCASGWQLQSGVCIDLNECLISSTCKPYEYCVNLEGSYNCKACDSSCETCAGSGSANCTSCKPSHELWSGICLNDEQKNDIIMSALKRTTTYISLMLVTFIIYFTSKPLASILVVILAVYICFYENTLNFHVVDVMKHFYGIYQV